MMHIHSILTIAVLGWGMCEVISPTYGTKLDAHGYESTKGQAPEFSDYSSAIKHHPPNRSRSRYRAGREADE